MSSLPIPRRGLEQENQKDGVEGPRRLGSRLIGGGAVEEILTTAAAPGGEGGEGAREEPRRSRSPVTEVGRHGRTSSLPRESVPVLELGRTSGVTSAGAWAARLEMANLLEARCDPTTLIKLAREGTEGDHPLDMSGKLKLTPQASFKVERVSEISERSKLSLDLGDSDEASSMGRGGESSRASMRSATEKRPEWAHPVVEKSTAPEKTYFSSIPQGLSFAKPAFPKGTKPEEKSKDGSHQDRRVEEEEVRESFAKVAKPPPRKERVLPDVPTATVGGKTAPKSMGEKESKDLAQYHELSLSIFNKLRVLGVEMDLLDLVKREDGSINGDRFSIRTSPNRASTGLRYARLMMNLLVWGERDERPLPEDSVPCNKLSVLDYVESIIQEGCGLPHSPCRAPGLGLLWESVWVYSAWWALWEGEETCFQMHVPGSGRPSWSPAVFQGSHECTGVHGP